MKLSDGTEVDLLPVGTRVRHRKFPELTGHIKKWEFMEDRKMVSAIPYCIAWDDNELAHHRLGFMFVYGGPETVEAIAEEARQ